MGEYKRHSNPNLIIPSTVLPSAQIGYAAKRYRPKFKKAPLVEESPYAFFKTEIPQSGSPEKPLQTFMERENKIKEEEKKIKKISIASLYGLEQSNHERKNSIPMVLSPRKLYFTTENSIQEDNGSYMSPRKSDRVSKSIHETEKSLSKIPKLNLRTLPRYVSTKDAFPQYLDYLHKNSPRIE